MYCPSCWARTVVYDQIANKSFVLQNASILGEYREKSSLRSASQARRQDSETGGGHKQIRGGGGTKTLMLRIRECGPKNKGLHLEICADFHEFWGEEKKSCLILKMREFLQIPG